TSTLGSGSCEHALISTAPSNNPHSGRVTCCVVGVRHIAITASTLYAPLRAVNGYPDCEVQLSCSYPDPYAFSYTRSRCFAYESRVRVRVRFEFPDTDDRADATHYRPCAAFHADRDFFGGGLIFSWQMILRPHMDCRQHRYTERAMVGATDCAVRSRI